MTMKQIYRRLIVCGMLLLVSMFTFAQERTVAGTVKDEAGVALPAVNIIIKGTTTGTTTDVDGNFSINVEPDDVLSFSFIGYETEEVSVGTQTFITVTMTEGLTTLSEVVVVGYGVQKKALN